MNTFIGVNDILVLMLQLIIYVNFEFSKRNTYLIYIIFDK